MAFRQGPRLGEGEGPERAIEIAAADNLPEKLTSLRCRCGSGYGFENGAPPQQGLIYDGRRLIVVTLKCEVCGASRDAYFAPVA